MIKLKSISLKFKFIMAFSLIFLFISALVFVAHRTITHLDQGYTNIVDEHYKTIELLQKQNISMLALRRYEKDFILRKKDKYIKKHTDETKVFNDLITETKAISAKENHATLDDIKQNLDQYNSGFQKIVNLFSKEGHSKSGIRGTLRSKAHEIELFLKGSKLSEFYTIQLLTFRRREKDYLLRRDNSYISKLESDINLVSTRMNSRGLDQERKEKLEGLISEYKNIFISLTKNYDQILKEIAGFRANVHALEGDIKELILLESEFMSFQQEELRSESKASIISFFAFAAIIGIMLIGLAVYFSKVVSSILMSVDQMKVLAKDFLGTSGLISSSSETLSQMASTQAAAIQETSSSVNQISAMVDKSADNATHSQAQSSESEKAAQEGKITVQSVIDAMGSLSESTVDMTNRFDQTNIELGDVVEIIKQIGEKAKVINDIVFQTKLLSFNASVEAARAGEHGKGFSVVAEEIGNLASMSGTSAEEISSILNESINIVNQLVTSSQSDFKKLVDVNNSRVENGISTAKACEVALNTIVENVGGINSSIAEIAQASNEQSSGVKEISVAISQFNASNLKTSAMAGQSQTHSKTIKENANEIFSMTERLENLLYGNKSDFNNSAEVNNENLGEELDHDYDKAA